MKLLVLLVEAAEARGPDGGSADFYTALLLRMRADAIATAHLLLNQFADVFLHEGPGSFGQDLRFRGLQLDAGIRSGLAGGGEEGMQYTGTLAVMTTT